MNVVDMQHEQSLFPLWRQAFRPFFLGGALFSLLAMIAWSGLLAGWLTFRPHGNPFFWHAHEMLFGFVAAIVTGFLLTAVQNWTGLRATHGRSLAALFGLWLAARILMALELQGAAWTWLVALVDLAFLPAVAILMARLVIAAGNHRNLVFLPILTLLTAANLLTHLSLVPGKEALFSWGMYAAILLVTQLMVVVAGRVTPMFTANGTGTTRVATLPWLEYATWFATGMVVLAYLLNGRDWLPAPLLSWLCALAALSNAVRAWRWRPWITLRVPLLWSLHIAYWFIPVGFALLALHYAGLRISHSSAIHALTAGAMGALILAMTARVSLGHSGRPLAPGPLVTLALGLVVLAGVSRLLAQEFPALSAGGYLVPATLWSLAYLGFVLGNARILTTPRPDGRPG